MIIKNQWIRTNIFDRIGNKDADLNIAFKPYHESFSEDFKKACLGIAKQIKEEYNKVFLALSGGLDSSYVFKILVEEGVPFTPVIVVIKGNRTNAIEVRHAFELCMNTHIKPEIIKITEKDLMKIYFDDIWKPTGTYGVFAVPILLCAKYAKENNGILLFGEHILNDRGAEIGLIVNDYDFVVETVVGTDILLPFFIYSEDVVYNMINNPYYGKRNMRNLLYGDSRDIPQNHITDRKIDKIDKMMKNSLHPGTKRKYLIDRNKILKMMVSQ